MPVSVIDELAAASHLTAEEYGAFVLLRLHQWQHGSLPGDDERLSRIAHVTPDRWPSVRSAIRSQFDKNWSHEATSKARQEREATHRRRSDAGKMGGRPPRRRKPDILPDQSRAVGPALVLRQPDNVLHESRAGSLTKADDQQTFPAIPDTKRARAWLLERHIFPGDEDKLLRLLMEGKLTPAILALSIP